MTQETEKKLEKLLNEKNDIIELLGKSPEDTLAVFAKEGIEMSLEDLADFSEGYLQGLAKGESGELSEETLSTVAGGGWLRDFVRGYNAGLSAGYSSILDNTAPTAPNGSRGYNAGYNFAKRHSGLR